MILEYECVNNKIIKICSEIKYLKEKFNNEWYEHFILKIINLLKNESRKINKKEKINFMI